VTNETVDANSKETRTARFFDWARGVHPFWYIIISLVSLFVWGMFGDAIAKDGTLDKGVVLAGNIVLAAIGSYGTYLQGELSLQDNHRLRQEKFRLHARARYICLSDFFWELHRISLTVEESQVVSMGEIDRLRVLSGVPDRMRALMRNIASSMRIWVDYAPKELEELHVELFNESVENRHGNPMQSS